MNHRNAFADVNHKQKKDRQIIDQTAIPEAKERLKVYIKVYHRKHQMYSLRSIAFSGDKKIILSTEATTNEGKEKN